MNKNNEDLNFLHEFCTNFNPASIEQLELIGKGGFGKIYCGRYLSLPIAIKTFIDFSLPTFIQELRLLRIFKHVNIPNLYGISIKQKHNHLHKINLIVELIEGTTFDKFLKDKGDKISEIEIIIHLVELSKVLEYLHKCKLIHRDLKPNNVMIDKNLNVKLLDFGISKVLKNNNTTTGAVGTVTYMAPESFDTVSDEQMMKSLISTKADVWSFGCMISEIISGVEPWAGVAKTHGILIKKLFTKAAFPIPKNVKCPMWIKLIEECTRIDPNERISMGEVKTRLQALLYFRVKDNKDNDFLSEIFFKSKIFINDNN
jgi:serine/threonine protein kinase